MVKKIHYPYTYGDKLTDTNWKMLVLTSFLLIGCCKDKSIFKTLLLGFKDEFQYQASSTYLEIKKDIKNIKDVF
jgi:hypothetical protein